jgi:hypothetical protein
MCTVLLPPGGNPITVIKYTISNHIISYQISDNLSSAIRAVTCVDRWTERHGEASRSYSRPNAKVSKNCVCVRACVCVCVGITLEALLIRTEEGSIREQVVIEPL